MITGNLFFILLAGAMLIDCKRSGQENDKADKQTNFYFVTRDLDKRLTKINRPIFIDYKRSGNKY